MSIGVLQSSLFGDMFGTAAMRAAFGELAFLARCAEVEAALARAQARVGIVPADAAAAITAAAAAVAADPGSLDLARLKRETETVGYPILPLVRQLADRAGPAGPARPGAGCTGAPQRRTSWTPPRCSRSATGWRWSKPI